MRRGFLFLTISLGLLATTGTAQSPSFNCNSAQSRSEVAICNDGTLAKLDGERELLFSQVYAAADDREKARLQRDYRSWREFRDLCGADRLCLARRHTARIDELKAAKSPLIVLEAQPQVRLVQPNVAVIAELPRTMDLRVLGDEINRKTEGTTPRLTQLEALAVVADLGADPRAAPDERVTVRADGTIVKMRQDGTGSFFNPTTGDRGEILSNGQWVNYYAMEVQPDELPTLPSDYNTWAEGVTFSLTGLVSNLLTAPEVETLESNAPPDFFDSLAFRLKILAFITS